MKRLFVALLCLMCIFNAHADNNTATSKDYVDAQIATLQDEVPAINSNTVLTHTGTSGEIGSKKIYDANSDYGSQTDALMTAGAFNAAVQNAIDTEFVCIDWLGEHVPGNCLLWKIQNKTPNQIVPDGYTEIEYLESTGTQYINTGIAYGPEDNGMAEVDIMFTELNRRYFGTNAYFQLTDTNNCLTIGYGLISCVSPYVRNKIIQTWDGPTTVSKLYIDNDMVGTMQWQRYYETLNYTIFALGASGAAPSSGKLFGLKLIKNGTVVRIFIPVRRNSDNVLGMYDTVSNTFFTNSGSGTFIAGPDMNSNLYLPTGN